MKISSTSCLKCLEVPRHSVHNSTRSWGCVPKLCKTILQISDGKASEKGEESSRTIESWRPVMSLYIFMGADGVVFDGKAVLARCCTGDLFSLHGREIPDFALVLM